MKVGSLKENAKLAPCVLSWFKVDMARSNTARFGDMTTAIQISQVRRKIRTASPGRDDPSLDEVVEVLDLNAAVLPQSYSRDELWRTFGPQTLQEACSFVVCSMLPKIRSRKERLCSKFSLKLPATTFVRREL